MADPAQTRADLIHHIGILNDKIMQLRAAAGDADDAIEHGLHADAGGGGGMAPMQHMYLQLAAELPSIEGSELYRFPNKIRYTSPAHDAKISIHARTDGRYTLVEKKEGLASHACPALTWGEAVREMRARWDSLG